MKQPKFPDIPQLYSMEQVAKVCGRSYPYMKRLFALNIPPEPRHCRSYIRQGERVKIRKWTQDEALALRKWFANVSYGSIKWRKAWEKKHK